MDQEPRAVIDLLAAINAVSDVVQNRPRPLREFDQIYMKTGDMVLQSELVCHWARDKRLAFIGDGDAISVCAAYLKSREILPYGPSRVTVFDFDERICESVRRFADSERLETLDAVHYNCLDAFPGPADFDCFYTNPPWGESNDGESVNVFVQRGMEAIAHEGEGMVVIGDDPDLAWTGRVLANLQSMALDSRFVVRRLMERVHSYHLDDNPELRSCNVVLRSNGDPVPAAASQSITDPRRLRNFYGRGGEPRVRYIRELKRLDYGKANESEYELDYFDPEASSD